VTRGVRYTIMIMSRTPSRRDRVHTQGSGFVRARSVCLRPSVIQNSTKSTKSRLAVLYTTLFFLQYNHNTLRSASHQIQDHLHAAVVSYNVHVELSLPVLPSNTDAIWHRDCPSAMDPTLGRVLPAALSGTQKLVVNHNDRRIAWCENILR
jgi:hypothetical protein